MCFNGRLVWVRVLVWIILVGMSTIRWIENKIKMKYSLQFLKLHWILSFKWFFVAKTSPKSNNRNKSYTKIILMKYFSIEVFQSPVSFSSENIKLIIVWRTYLPYDHSPITKGIFLNYISKSIPHWCPLFIQPVVILIMIYLSFFFWLYGSSMALFYVRFNISYLNLFKPRE